MNESPTAALARSRIAEAIAMLGPLATVGVSLRELTTFRVGGIADVLVRVHDLAEVRRVSEVVAATGVHVMVVGQGSNLLVSDEGFRGVVVVLAGTFAETLFPIDPVDPVDPIDLVEPVRSAVVQPRSTTSLDNFTSSSEISTLDAQPENLLQVTAGGGVKLPILARQSASRGFGGLEWMVGVPGSVGGAVRMNAGGHGSDVAANLAHAEIWRVGADAPTRIESAELGLRYRHSNLRDTDLVLTATFNVIHRNAQQAEQELAEIVRWRREHQPGGANCGSVFTNPEGDSAGRLIDAAGLRGLRIGTASVSEKHANFIQADEHASADDIWALIIEVRKRVFDIFGITLHPEVRTAGFDAVLPALSTSPVDSNE